MLGYLWMVLSAFLFSMQIIFTKLFEDKCGKAFSATTCFSLISSTLITLVLLFVNRFNVTFTWFSLLMGFLLAAVTVAANLLGIQAMARGKVSVYTLFLMLGGTVVPFFVGVAFLGEAPLVLRFIASGILIAALALPTLDRSEKSDGKSRTLFLILCSVLFLLNGANSSIGAIHQDEMFVSHAVGTTDFLIITYGFQAVISLLLFLFSPGKGKFRCLINPNALVSSLGFGTVHILATFLQLRSALTVDASLLYPFITGATLIFTPLLSLVLFKEKIGKFTAGCIVLSALAGILFVF